MSHAIYIDITTLQEYTLVEDTYLDLHNSLGYHNRLL